MHGIKRPSNKDTEEDLLKFQQEFENMKSKDPNFQSNISAELINVDDNETELPMIDELIFKNNDTLPSILHKVTEISNNQLPNLPQESSLPFPKAVSIDYKMLEKSAVTDGAGKKSLFALHMEKQRKGDILGTQHTQHVNVQRDVIALEGQTSNFDSLLTGEGLVAGSNKSQSEVDKIHQENIDKLKCMTTEEILEEQAKVRASLDPNLLDFLQKRKRKHEIADESDKNVTSDLERSNLSEDVQGLITEAKKQKWKHFDLIENAKLEWMQTNENELEKKEFQRPRFDFQGFLVPLDADIPTETALFHHGEEGDRPGYTLEELITLSDSSLQSQKILSLQTLACIAKNAQNDNSINQHLEVTLLKVLVDIGIPLVFRVAMDSTTVSIICLGILGIRNLLVNNTDCKFLQTFQLTTLGVSLPLIKSTLQPLKETEQEFSDLEILQQDLVQGLIKTNILTRIKYILETVKPPPTTVICCIEILTHFSRYAKSIATQIVNTEKLISLILNYFLPFELTFEKEPGSYGQPCMQAMRLFYHLIAASKSIATLLSGRDRVMEILLQFALLETRNFIENKEQISEFIIYSLHTLRALACYGIGLDYFQTGYEIFVNKLQHFIGKFTEIDDNEANCLTSLIQYISEISLCLASSREHKIELLNPIINIILGISQKATLHLQISLEKGQLKIISAILHLFTTLTNKSIIAKFNSPVGLISQLESFTTAQYTPLYKNKLMKQIFINLIQTTTNPDNVTHNSSFPTLLWNNEVDTNYVVTSDFLYNMINFYLSICTQLNHLKIKSPFYIPGLDDVIIKYLHSIVAQHNRTNSTSAFFLLEIPLIYKLLILCESQLDTSSDQTRLCQNIIFFLISNLQTGQDFYLNTLINKYLFSHKFYEKYESTLTSEELKSIQRNYSVLLQFLNITQASIDNSQMLYNRNGVAINSLSLQSFTGPLLPIDWITMPIFVLYNKEESASGFQTNVRFLTDCLKYYNWAESNNIYFLSTIHSSTRVARIMLAFLLGDLFLTDEISQELVSILNTYSRKEFVRTLDFSAIQGVTDFCELYSELCAHYTSVSFGDPTFAQFLLIPLISNPSTNIKLMLWKNTMDIFRLFPIPIHDFSLPIDGLFKPYETDTRVLSEMIQMLLQGKLRYPWSPVFYFMAIHHVTHFISTEPSGPNEKLMGDNFIGAMIGAEKSLFEDFVCYDEPLSLSEMRFEKKDISQAKLRVNTVYKEALDNYGSETGRERKHFITFN